jgi:Ser/Thr protein kinase RdoA (MazF antagonist)
MNRVDAGADALMQEAGPGTVYASMSETEALELIRSEFGIYGDLTRLVAEKDDSFHLDATDGQQFVLKVAKPTAYEMELSFQIELLLHIERTDPSIPVPRLVRDTSGRPSFTMLDGARQSRGVRLMSYLTGTLLESTDCSAMERFRVGEVLGRLRHATEEFRHPAESRVLAWDVKHLPKLRYLLDHVEDSRKREKLRQGMDRFLSIYGRVSRLRAQVLHNDFSRLNIVVDHGDPRFVTGIIDFGHAVRTAIAIDVSTALLSHLPRHVAEGPPIDDLFSQARDVLRGYLSVADLTAEELQLLPHLVMGRILARALITLWRKKKFPESSTYILRNTEQGWAHLDWFLDRSVSEVSSILT